jgi:hypothetical protein
MLIDIIKMLTDFDFEVEPLCVWGSGIDNGKSQTYFNILDSD